MGGGHHERSSLWEIHVEDRNVHLFVGFESGRSYGRDATSDRTSRFDDLHGKANALADIGESNLQGAIVNSGLSWLYPGVAEKIVRHQIIHYPGFGGHLDKLAVIAGRVKGKYGVSV
jgi:hypothetical protein